MSHLPDAANDEDAALQRRTDRGRVVRAFNLSLGFVVVLVAIFACQHLFDWHRFAVLPHAAAGLVGLLTAPLLHASIEHLGANAAALLILGTLTGSVYPRASIRSLPLLWLGSGLGAWLLGEPGSFHLGASGVAHGLMFLVFVLGLLRRDRAAIAAGMIAFLFYGGMLMTVLPHEAGVSWQSHLGGAIGGVLGALLFRSCDPRLPRQRYSWEDEDEEDGTIADDAAAERDSLEPARPEDVPVLWRRPAETGDGNVLPFRRRQPPDG